MKALLERKTKGGVTVARGALLLLFCCVFALLFAPLNPGEKGRCIPREALDDGSYAYAPGDRWPSGLLLPALYIAFDSPTDCVLPRVKAGEPAAALATGNASGEVYGEARRSAPGVEDLLIPGDILLGRCRLSPVPSLNPLENWTHVALYAGEGELLVAPNPRQRVMRTTLSSWMYPRMTWVTYLRVTSADDGIRNEAVEFALEEIGQPYDINWLSKQPRGDSWYCSEFIWAAYLEASDGLIDLEHDPDALGISPNEIYMDEETEVIGGHYESKPDTMLSMMMKVFVLCLLVSGAQILLGPPAFPASRRRESRRRSR